MAPEHDPAPARFDVRGFSGPTTSGGLGPSGGLRRRLGKRRRGPGLRDDSAPRRRSTGGASADRGVGGSVPVRSASTGRGSSISGSGDHPHNASSGSTGITRRPGPDAARDPAVQRVPSHRVVQDRLDGPDRGDDRRQQPDRGDQGEDRGRMRPVSSRITAIASSTAPRLLMRWPITIESDGFQPKALPTTNPGPILATAANANRRTKATMSGSVPRSVGSCSPR